MRSLQVSCPSRSTHSAVSSANATSCWAVGSTAGIGGVPNGAALVATRDGGATWTPESVPATVGYLSDVACTDTRHCLAVGQVDQSTNGLGAVVGTVDGGGTWSLQSLPAGTTDVTAVTCLPNRHCIAMAEAGASSWALATNGPGAAWHQAGTLPSGLLGVTAVSCTDALHCWATAHTAIDVDHRAGAVATTADGGATWTAVAVPSGVGTLDALSCFDTSPAPTASTTAGEAAPVAAWCAVAGTTETGLDNARTGRGLVLTTADGGASWTSQPTSGLAAAWTGLSCLAPGSCVAVGATVASEPEAGLALFTDPSSSPWRHASVVRVPLSLAAVDCVALSACVAVGQAVSQRLTGG